MSARARKWILVLLAVFLLLPVVLYFLADAWLESSGGRQMLEHELTRRMGMEVRMNGEFHLMLLPDIGVSGTDLVIGGETLLASSREFEVSVELRPLLRRQVVVEWIRLSGGVFYPDRYTQSGDSSGSAAIQLPQVRELALRDFQMILAGDQESTWQLNTLEIRDFAQGHRASFSFEVEGLATASGWLLWDTLRSKIRFGDLRLGLGGQQLFGEGCLLLQEPRSFNATLKAESLDFDAFRDSLPETVGDGGELPLDFRVGLNVDVLSSGGVTARGVLLNIGQEPACD